MLETITKLKAPQKRTSSASKWPAPYAIMSHLWILYYLTKGVVVRLDDGGRIVGHPSRCWCWHRRRRTCWVKSDRRGDGASGVDGGNMYVDEELWWWWLWGGGGGFRPRGVFRTERRNRVIRRDSREEVGCRRSELRSGLKEIYRQWSTADSYSNLAT